LPANQLLGWLNVLAPVNTWFAPLNRGMFGLRLPSGTVPWMPAPDTVPAFTARRE